MANCVRLPSNVTGRHRQVQIGRRESVHLFEPKNRPNTGNLQNADSVFLSNSTPTTSFDVDGTSYTLNLAFGSVTGGGFSEVNQFFVLEGGSASANLLDTSQCPQQSRVASTGSDPTPTVVPEPSTVSAEISARGFDPSCSSCGGRDEAIPHPFLHSQGLIKSAHPRQSPSETGLRRVELRETPRLGSLRANSGGLDRSALDRLLSRVIGPNTVRAGGWNHTP